MQGGALGHSIRVNSSMPISLILPPPFFFRLLWFNYKFLQLFQGNPVKVTTNLASTLWQLVVCIDELCCTIFQILSPLLLCRGCTWYPPPYPEMDVVSEFYFGQVSCMQRDVPEPFLLHRYTIAWRLGAGSVCDTWRNLRERSGQQGVTRDFSEIKSAIPQAFVLS